MKAEIRHLRYFLAIAEELNFSRAAEKLRIAQPPLSQQIRQLENELGVSLIERETRPVRLTEAGKFFREQALAIVGRFDELIAKTQKMGRGETGSLSLAFVGSATFELLPAVLREFIQSRPDVELQLLEMNATEQKAALLERRINVGFCRPGIEGEALIIEPLLEEPIISAIPEGHPLSKLENVPLSRLASEPFIFFPVVPEPSFGAFLRSVCIDAGFEPRVVQVTSELQTALSLVAGGIGIALLPASIQMVQRTGVVYVPLSKPVPTTALNAAYRQDDSSPALAAFLDIMRQTLGISVTKKRKGPFP
jgi:LysR family transcriptional regulator, benzoate and cis,cis-muconate-responsive activator of ben and cat genes